MLWGTGAGCEKDTGGGGGIGGAMSFFFSSF